MEHVQEGKPMAIFHETKYLEGATPQNNGVQYSFSQK